MKKQKKEFVEFVTKEYLGLGTIFPKYYYGDIIENTKRGTSIVNIRYSLISFTLFKEEGRFFKKKKLKKLSFYSDKYFKIETDSKKLKRSDEISIKKKKLEYIKEIKKYLDDGWKFKE